MIFITLVPYGSNRSAFQINWGPNCTHEIQRIGEADTSDIFSTDESPAGFHRINHSAGDNQFILPGKWSRAQARTTKLDFWPPFMPDFAVIHYNDRHNVHTCCVPMQIYPDWMATSPEIHKIPLKHLLVPGTHCSGCYRYSFGGDSTLLQRFGYLQSFDIWTQLIFGIRYLDITVG